MLVLDAAFSFMVWIRDLTLIHNLTFLISIEIKWSSNIWYTARRINTNSLTLLLDHVTWTSIGVIYLLGESRNFQTKGSEILSRHFLKTGSLTLTVDHVSSKSIGVIYSIGASTVVNLANFKQRDQEILGGQHFNIDLWPCDLKINRGHILPRGIICTKFGNFKEKGSKDIKRI